ncbi:hypothetical protein Bca52824_057662 [Brassica carinata]|uniref:Ubiquitin-like domain-containing protein n=1 Tax=Brassica carinata TaxID=52824 RepID=A0A8X7QRP2_BRACI|nr:hypothetical protein Bca52824_057662 [Brassica carinata]
MSDKGRPLPKFGEWDVNDPASAEGFTVIFNKARDEKRLVANPDHPDDVDVYFRIKKDVGLRKMMEAFSVKKGEDMSAFAFLFDGVHIKPDQTPNQLELEDGDEIQAFLHQLAGVLSFCAA